MKRLHFKPGHFDFMKEGNEGFEKKINSIHGEEGVYIYSFIEDNEVLAVICIEVVHKTFADISACISDSVNKHGFGFSRGIKKFADLIMTRSSIKRAQMMVSCDYSVGVRFARFLGFETEGVMRNAGSDCKSHYLMARCE